MKKTRKLGAQARRNSYGRIEFRPSLLLAGVWMEQAGFAIGQQVRVQVSNAGTPAAKITIEQ